MEFVSVQEIDHLLSQMGARVDYSYVLPNAAAQHALVAACDEVPTEVFYQLTRYLSTKTMSFTAESVIWIKQHPATCYQLILLFAKGEQWGWLNQYSDYRQFAHNIWRDLTDSFEGI